MRVSNEQAADLERHEHEGRLGLEEHRVLYWHHGEKALFGPDIQLSFSVPRIRLNELILNGSSSI